MPCGVVVWGGGGGGVPPCTVCCLNCINQHILANGVCADILQSYSGGLLCCAWGPDGSLIAAGGEVTLFSTSTMPCRHDALQEQPNEASACVPVCMSTLQGLTWLRVLKLKPRNLAYTQDDLVCLYSLEERAVVAWGGGHTSWVSALAFDPTCVSALYVVGPGCVAGLCMWARVSCIPTHTPPAAACTGTAAAAAPRNLVRPGGMATILTYDAGLQGA